MISTNEKKYFMSISVLKELVITWKAETEKDDVLAKFLFTRMRLLTI